MDGLNRWIVGRRAAFLAAALVLIASLPGLLALPVLDRDEARAAQAAAQMMDEGDYAVPRFQTALREGAPPGAPWLQALSVHLFSSVEARTIQPYRLPSLLGIMLAAAACVWGARGLFGPAAGGVAGIVFASCGFAALAGGTAGPDALFIGSCTLALAAFGRVYAGASGKAGRRAKALFWAGIILGVMVKGPLILGLAILTGAALFAIDRRADWLKSLGWSWGLIALFAIAGPWVVAVSVATDGAFWSRGIEPLGKGSPVGVQTLAAPFFLFPAAVLLPFAAVFGWKNRALPGVRLAAAWTLPAWIVFELSHGRQAHDAAPLYIGVIWVGAAAMTLAWAPGYRTRQVAVAAALVSSLGLAVAAVVLAGRFGAGDGLFLAILCAALSIASGGAAAAAAFRETPVQPLIIACLAGALAQSLTVGFLLPRLDRLWPTREALAALGAAGLDPRDGIAVGPVAAAGYAEPSLVFALGAPTETADAEAAAEAIAEGRPAIVEARQDAAFKREARKIRAKPKTAGVVEGFDYVRGETVRLTIYGP